jgi:hypothetical protein
LIHRGLNPALLLQSFPVMRQAIFGCFPPADKSFSDMFIKRSGFEASCGLVVPVMMIGMNGLGRVPAG